MNPSSGIFKRVTKAFGSFSISALLHGASVSVHGGVFFGMPMGLIASPVLFVLSELFAHFSAETTAHISDDILNRIGKNPKELNHDLQGLFAEAVKQAIEEGIPISYEKENFSCVAKSWRGAYQSGGGYGKSS